jgi:flagellar motility protein MotE (MotC chaperone)
LKRIRLLPLVLIAVSALLGVKLLELAMGVGSFALGPETAVASGAAQGEGGKGEGEGEAAAPTVVDDTGKLLAPVDLATEFRKQEEAAKAAASHGEAGGHGEAAPSDGHGETAPADAKAAPAAGHGEAAPADAKAAQAAPADAKAAPADANAAPAAAAPAGHGEAAPAAGHGEAAPAEGHGAAAKTKPGTAYTTRPNEYQPPIGSSETAILEGLSARREELDQREQDIDMRMKLLKAAEQRLDQRFQELKSIETQLGAGDTPPAGAPGAPGAANPGVAPGAAGAPAAAAPANDQMAALVSLYEGMKPKAAAVVFDQLDLTVLLGIASKMNPRKLAPVLAAMSPDKAGALTTAMVGKQLAPRQIIVTTETGTGAATDPASLPQIQAAPTN